MYSWFYIAWELLISYSEVDYFQNDYNEEFELADMLLWLISLYDIYFDYQSLIGEESGNYQHKEIRCQKWMPQIIPFIHHYVESLLLGEIMENDFWIVESDNDNRLSEDNWFMFYEYGDSKIVTALNLMISKQIYKRREIITKILKAEYNNNPTKILLFMSGYEYRDNYSDYYDKLRILEENKKEKIKLFNEGCNENYYDEDEIVVEYEENVEHLRSEYPVSIENLEYVLSGEFNYEIISQVGPVYEWIENGLRPLEE